MITVKYRGRLGNQMFQYAFARLLALETGLALTAPPIPGFPKAMDVPGKWNFSAPISITDLPPYVNKRADFNIHNRNLSLTEIASTCRGRAVQLDGYFERLDFFEGRHAEIRSWFGGPSAPNETTVVNVRGGDYIVDDVDPLPVSYFKRALEITGNTDALVVTDSPDRLLVRQLELPIEHGSIDYDFNRIRNARKIITSLSTFSWWAAFLSNAEVIVQPSILTGFRSKACPHAACLDQPSWIKVPTGWHYLTAEASREYLAAQSQSADEWPYVAHKIVDSSLAKNLHGK